jgi:hypothetical protein
MPNDDKKQPTSDNQSSPIIFSEDTVPPLAGINPAPPTPVADPIPATPTDDINNSSPATTVGINNSGSASPANDVITDTVMPAVVTTGAPKKKFAGGKTIATILGIFLLVGGIGAGVYLTGQNQNIGEKASWELDQRCQQLKLCGAGCRQEYNSDCGGGDDNPPPPVITPPPTPFYIAKCQRIQAYNEAWTLLTTANLSTLKAGDKVNFCAVGATNNGSFDKAKFTINGTAQAETTTKRPSSNDYCQLYTIAASVNTFNVNAQVHHTTLGWK